MDLIQKTDLDALTFSNDNSAGAGGIKVRLDAGSVVGDALAAVAAMAGGMPAGAVAPFAMATAPAGWLKANGALVSRTAYAALFAAIGTTYGAGDGSTTFALPDLRGQFLRGWDDGRGIDTGRVLGSSQMDAMQDHKHALWQGLLFTGFGFGTYGSSMNGSGVPDSSMLTGFASGIAGNRTAAETRPRNVALLLCIKF